MNTEFYGMHRMVMSTLVLGTHVCKLYSASTLILFFKCFLHLKWRHKGVSQFTLNVLCMFLEHFLNVARMFPYSRWRGRLRMTFSVNTSPFVVKEGKYTPPATSVTA